MNEDQMDGAQMILSFRAVRSTSSATISDLRIKLLCGTPTLQ